MQLRTDTAVLELKPGQLVALDDAAGTSVSARCGSVWITEEGDPSDFVLEAGDKRIIARAGRTLIQAMQPSWVSIRPS